MATVSLRLFAAAREAAGLSAIDVTAETIGDVLAWAREQFGAGFTAVLAGSRVWVDGEEPVDGDATIVTDGCEVAVLPPVSGG